MFLISFLTILACASASAGRDPCLMVCELFTADRQGNGFDLCDSPILSRCSHNSCSHLFWGVDEDGQRGLIYSLNGSGTPLTLREQTNRLTCEQARDIVGWVPDWSFFDSALEVFVHLPYVRAAIASNNTRFPFLNSLRNHGPGSMSVRDYLTSVGENPIWDGELTAFDAFDSLVRSRLPNRSPGHSHIIQRVTANCGTCNISSGVPQMPLGSLRQFFAQNITMHVDIEEALVNGTKWTEHRRCRSCDSIATVSMVRQIENVPEFLILHFPRFHDRVRNFIDSEYTFPMLLNVSRAFPTFTAENPMYELIATLHRTSAGPHFFSEFLENDRWFRHDEGANTLIEKSSSSNSAETFIYRKI